MRESINELDPDFIDNLDNISLTETDGLSTAGRFNEHLAYVNSNAYTLKRTFAKYIEFDDGDEDDLIFAIQDSENINWDEVSMLPKLPEFIMKEFQNKLNWNLTFFHRRMATKTIKLFKKHLFNVTNRTDFLSKLNDTNANLFDIIVNVNAELTFKIFNQACQNNYVKWISTLLQYYKNISSREIKYIFYESCHHTSQLSIVRVLMNNPTISPEDIQHGFMLACYYKSMPVFNILIDNPAISPKTVTDLVIDSCKMNRIPIIEFLLNNKKITESDKSYGRANASHANNQVIVDMLDQHR
jgi:hypothetical protein